MLYRKFFKRPLDLFISIPALALSLPFLFLISIAIKFETRGPAFFMQMRSGRDNKLFKLYKFRTMRIPEDSINSDGSEMENYARVTRVGNILRRTSLDEFPQLINVLKGDMSVVGPRPTLPYQTERYGPRELQRLAVRPGLTGLAQINGRNSLSWGQKIDYDIHYIEHLNFLTDLRIILLTVPALMRESDNKFMQHDKFSVHEGTLISDVINVRDTSDRKIQSELVEQEESRERKSS